MVYTGLNVIELNINESNNAILNGVLLNQCLWMGAQCNIEWSLNKINVNEWGINELNALLNGIYYMHNGIEWSINGCNVTLHGIPMKSLLLNGISINYIERSPDKVRYWMEHQSRQCFIEWYSVSTVELNGTSVK